MNTVRIRKERFLQWVKSKNPNSIVGSTRGEDTPVNRYLAVRGRASATRPAQNTGWVAEFVNALSQRKSSKVTARTVVKLLS